MPGLHRKTPGLVAYSRSEAPPGIDPAAMIIPHQELSPEALQGLIEEFVTRDGADYGERDTPLEDKVAQVRRQLLRREEGTPRAESGSLPRPRNRGRQTLEHATNDLACGVVSAGFFARPRTGYVQRGYS